MPCLPAPLFPAVVLNRPPALLLALPLAPSRSPPSGARVTVKRDGSSAEEALDAAKADIFPANEAGMMTNDHCALIHLNEPCILENSRLRFDKEKIYTYTGKILVALNPFAKLSIYGKSALPVP